MARVRIYKLALTSMVVHQWRLQSAANIGENQGCMGGGHIAAPISVGSNARFFGHEWSVLS